MNILHVLSQFEVTGAETFAATLANYQSLKGHSTYIISDTFQTNTNAQVIHYPIGIRNVIQRIRNIIFLKKFIASHQIDVVHAHSRAASWVSFFATRKGNVPLVSTVHGRQHVHFSSRSFHIYGEKVMPVSRSIYLHMNTDLNYPLNTMKVVHNGIDFAQWKHEVQLQQSSRKKIALIGRLSGPKGDVARTLITQVFPVIQQHFSDCEFHVVGRLNNSYQINDVNTSGVQITMHGHVDDLSKIYHQFDLIIGSGRVALEAIASGRTVCAVGESNYVGIVSEKNIDQAIETNFGDTGKKMPMEPQEIQQDIIAFLSKAVQDTEAVRTQIEKLYDIKYIAQEIFHCYADAKAVKIGIREIPVLMYHRVTPAPPPGTQHGIFVTMEEFERQLLSLQRRGFTTLTFQDITEIIEGKQKMPRRPVFLTFDDGYQDNYENAYPLLKKFQMKGVIFLIADPQIRSNIWDVRSGEPEVSLLHDEQIKEMSAYGIEFGSHTIHHPHLTYIEDTAAWEQISVSKKMLEERLGIPINSFAYPYGAFKEQHKIMVKEAGYQYGIATDSGRRSFWSDFYKIRRIPIFPHTSSFQFWKKTSGKYHWYKHVY